MQVRVFRWGDGLAVRLPKELTEQLALEEGETIDIFAEDRQLRIGAVPARRGPTLEELVAEAERLGPESEPPYEDWGILPSEWPAYEDEGHGRK